MATHTYVNPKPFIHQLIGKVIRIKLIFGMEYIGRLKYADAYINLALENVFEYLDESYSRYLPNLVIRCSSILYVRESPWNLEFLPPSRGKETPSSQQAEEEES